jgi:hypothetical protein
MKRLIVALFLSGCAAQHSYMMPMIEVRCPIAFTKAQCETTISSLCKSSYVVIYRGRSGNDRIWMVSCEAKD